MPVLSVVWVVSLRFGRGGLTNGSVQARYARIEYQKHYPAIVAQLNKLAAWHEPTGTTTVAKKAFVEYKGGKNVYYTPTATFIRFMWKTIRVEPNSQTSSMVLRIADTIEGPSTPRDVHISSQTPFETETETGSSTWQVTRHFSGENFGVHMLLPSTPTLHSEQFGNQTSPRPPTMPILEKAWPSLEKPGVGTTVMTPVLKNPSAEITLTMAPAIEKPMPALAGAAMQTISTAMTLVKPCVQTICTITESERIMMITNHMQHLWHWQHLYKHLDMFHQARPVETYLRGALRLGSDVEVRRFSPQSLDFPFPVPYTTTQWGPESFISINPSHFSIV